MMDWRFEVVQLYDTVYSELGINIATHRCLGSLAYLLGTYRDESQSVDYSEVGDGLPCNFRLTRQPSHVHTRRVLARSPERGCPAPLSKLRLRGMSRPAYVNFNVHPTFPRSLRACPASEIGDETRHLPTMSNPSESQAQQSSTANNMPPPNPTPLSLTLILAATPSLGIGKAGTLPWPQLRKEMGYFRRVTSRVPPSSSGSSRRRCNAVIMGRKTWDSIPPKFRPLEGRVNVVVTRSPEAFSKREEDDGRNGDGDAAGAGTVGQDVEVVASISEALDRLRTYNSSPAKNGDDSPEIARVFVIGGATIYDAALKLPEAERVLLTRIEKEFECDTFFGADLEGSREWRRCGGEELREWTGEGESVEGVVEEKGVRFGFGMYEKVRG